jgi:hypothetical protein
MAPQLPDMVGLLFMALPAVLVVTPALSLLVLWWYRRAVGRSMRTTAQGRHVVPTPVPDRPHTRARPAPVVVLDGTRPPADHLRGPADDLWRQSRRRLTAAVGVYTAAGLAFGLVVAATWLTAGDVAIGPRNLLTLAVVHAWPLVPTVITLVAATRPVQALVWAGYAALLLLGTAVTGITLAETGVLVAMAVAPPALVFLALGGRRFRAVGPFLAVPVLLITVGLLLQSWTALWAMWFGASADVGRGLAVVAAVLLGIAGFAHLAWAGRQYARKRAGDQMLAISQWWFLAAAWESVTLLPAGIGAGLGAWGAYVVFRVVLAVGMRLRPRPSGPPRRLLLLRTFGAPRRSEMLLRRLGARWRHIGTIMMIAGPDLVSAALEPHEFLDLLRGRLARRFVGSPDDLRSRFAELDDRPDPDGRYRVGELFCHDDMWRPALQTLLHHTDSVLLDARGFGRQHEGVAWEITQLAQLVPLDRVLVLIDHTTDEYYLRAIVDRARLDSADPESGTLRLLRTHSRHVDPAVVVGQLGRSA